ncbi:MAG: hypothetical protein RIQ70_626 [Bacteroidota bacterium]|jgi:hypothetical protein
MNNIKTIDELEHQVNDYLPDVLKEFIKCRSDYYSEIAYGFNVKDHQKAEIKYIAAMYQLLKRNISHN